MRKIEKIANIKNPRLKDFVFIKFENELITRKADDAPKLEATNIIFVANLLEDLSTSLEALENM